MRNNTLNTFNQDKVITEGWYWVIQSAKLKKSNIKGVRLMGREIVVYRGYDDKTYALDAYCPHMGAHLKEGKIEGNQIRCFFHHWRFNGNGDCTDIPCIKNANHIKKSVKTKNWYTCEQDGIIWLWIGEEQPNGKPPIPEELNDNQYDYSIGRVFYHNCHPNVTMINAIDEQHFRSVHYLPPEYLSMNPVPNDKYSITFDNTAKFPVQNLWTNFLSLFYKKNSIFYNLKYYYGTQGTVSIGPDFLHLYVKFALRYGEKQTTEGITIAYTKKRRTIFGKLLNKIILFVTKNAIKYFAYGDSKVFQSTKFDFKNPVQADKSIIAFVNHTEAQTVIPWWSNSHG